MPPAFMRNMPSGRWPANIVHDGGEEVLAAFPDSDQSNAQPRVRKTGDVYGEHRDTAYEPIRNSGSAARFFYSAKAGADDRLGSKHPTVKPVELMRWLVRLVTPPGGKILDPFAGTGTTGHAALLEGFSAILIEREAEYRADITRRMALVFAGDHEKTLATKKQDDHAGLPLFGGTNDAGGGIPSRPTARASRIGTAGQAVEPDHRTHRTEELAP